MLSKDLDCTIFYRGIKNLWKLMNIRKRFKIIPLLSCFVAATEIQLSPYHNICANVLEKSTSFIDKFCLAWKKNEFGKGCYTHRFATTIFSATQRYNIVAALFRMATTLFQHCNNVLRWKSWLRIVPCNITLTAAWGKHKKLYNTMYVSVVFRNCHNFGTGNTANNLRA